MLSAMLTMFQQNKKVLIKATVSFSLLFFSMSLFAQDNSPYSRYGLGDVVPNTNIVNRGMGGISAGYADGLSVNFGNPASYTAFQRFFEQRAKQSISGRVLLDVGLNIENRTLRKPNTTQKFTTSNALFSYLNVGIPLRKNWGLSFGLKPVSRISYKIRERGSLSGVDSMLTEYSGNGGSYLPSIGTGFGIKNLSVGVNVGYLFGKRESITKKAIVSDTVAYNNGSYTTRTSFGNLFLNAGVQYRINITKQTYLRLGASGNLQQTLNASQDLVRETFVQDGGGTGDATLDTVSSKQNIKGKIIYPASYTAGFVLEHINSNLGGWLIGADFIQNNWDDFRFFNAKDAVQDNWQLRIGGQFRPQPKRTYFSNVTYRAGFFTGPDYINAGGELPQFGGSLGLGLPLANYNRSSIGQYTIINLAMEYNKRGNNDNLLKENTFRFSVGLNFSDVWFTKRKYD